MRGRFRLRWFSHGFSIGGISLSPGSCAPARSSRLGELADHLLPARAAGRRGDHDAGHAGARSRLPLLGGRHRDLDDQRPDPVHRIADRPVTAPPETAAVRKRAGSHNGVEDDHRPWTDDDREQARRLQAEGLSQATMLATLPRPHRDLTSSAFDGSYGRDGMMVKRNRLRSEPWRTTAASTRASRSRSR